MPGTVSTGRAAGCAVALRAPKENASRSPRRAPARARRRARFRSGTETSQGRGSVMGFVYSMLGPPSTGRGRFPDRVDGTGHDQLLAQPAKLGAGPARIAVDAVPIPQPRSQPPRADQARVDGQHEGGVGEPGVGAQLVLPVAPRPEELAELGV